MKNRGWCIRAPVLFFVYMGWGEGIKMQEIASEGINFEKKFVLGCNISEFSIL